MPALYYATGHVAGEECSSTYEGRHLTLEESYLIHPYHADGLVDKGDPVLFAVGSTWMNGVGVALNSASAATDLIAIDTEGIWYLDVTGCISDGSINGQARVLNAGDPIYIRKAGGTVGDPDILSGEDDANNYVPFGYLLGTVAASVSVHTLAAVKVHWDPNCLETINVGSYSTPAAPVIDNLEIDISATARAAAELGESWGIEYAWLKAYIGLSAPLQAGEDMQGIYVRLEDNKHSTGGDLFAGRFQTHANHADGDWTRLYGLYVAISNEQSVSIAESIGVAIAMGGNGCSPAMQTAIQIMGDGTLAPAGKQAWFQTEIGRGAGLEAQNTNVAAKTHQIPILIDGTRYAIPVIPWI